MQIRKFLRNRKTFNVVAIILLVTLDIAIGFFILLPNIADWIASFPRERVYAITITYPKIEGIFDTTSNSSIIVYIYLTYQDLIAENQPVTIDAIGAVPSIDVTSIWVGYLGALPYFENGLVMSVSHPFWGVNLLPNNDTHPPMIYSGQIPFASQNKEIIAWQVQGNYYPSMTIFYRNGSFVTYDYPEYPIHVNSIDVIKQQKIARINTALSISVVIFAFVESFMLIEKAWESGKQDCKSIESQPKDITQIKFHANEKE